MADRNPAPFFRPVKQALVTILITLLIFGLALLFYTVRWVVLVVLIGIGLGILFSPIVGFLKAKLRFPSGLSAFFLFLFSLAVALGVTAVVVVIISDQLLPFLKTLPELARSAQERLAQLLDQYPWLRDPVRNFDVGQTLQDAAQVLFKGVRSGVTAITGFIFILFVALYFAVNPESYLRGFLSLFPAYLRGRAKEIMHNSAVTLRRWFVSQLIAMSAVGVATALGLGLIGIDYWLLLGLTTAVLDIVPYIGPFMGFLAVLAVTLATSPEKIIWAIALYLIIQQLEGNLLIPLIMKGRINLPPIHLMALMLILASLFGILGILVAPPLLAVGRTVFQMTYVARMNEKIAPDDLQKSA